jgi:dUTP pyrophosphatase
MKINYIGPYSLVQHKEGDCGYDIAANEQKTIYPGTSGAVSTGLFMAIPYGWYGKIESRSGWAFNHKIETGAGVIDPNYRGEIKVLLYNSGDLPLNIKEGDRIAQIIIQPYADATFMAVHELDETVRGAAGFGSSGIKQAVGGA